MSLTFIAQLITSCCFPRVSGDEPLFDTARACQKPVFPA